MVCLRGILLCLSLFAAGTATAQDSAPSLQSPILTVDRDRLFSGSQHGQNILQEIEAQSRALAAENRRIEAELEAEEQSLTQQRSSLPAEEFRALAADFDAKVVAIRTAQDTKTRELTRNRDAVQQRFFQDTVPILADIVRERGGVVVLENRAVFLSAQQIDITDDAIARIDAQLAQPDPVAPPEADE